MADYIENKLIINCSDLIIKNKIKMLIFSENDKKEQIFTMGKMLPMPEGFSETVGWNDFGSDWTYAVWGAKWVRGSKILESGHTISIYYDTPWVPNLLWVETLCRYIDCVSNKYEYRSMSEVRKEISVTLTYCDAYEDFGNRMEWSPDQGFQFTENVSFFNR